MTQQITKRGILQLFNTVTYTADVLIIEATSYVLSNVPIATHVDGTSAIVGASCAVLFLDAHNPTDAIIVAIYGQAPTPPPGRVTFIAPTVQVNGDVIASGVTNTYTISGIPNNALGIIFKAFFRASVSPAHIDLAAHGGNLSETCSLGEVTSTSQTLNGSGILPLSPDGRIDIKANNGNCTTTLYVYGYII